MRQQISCLRRLPTFDSPRFQGQSFPGSSRGETRADAVSQRKQSPQDREILGAFWLRGLDLNQRPLGYEHIHLVVDFPTITRTFAQLHCEATVPNCASCTPIASPR